MYEALQKIKAELVILGFISLLLTFGQSYIIQICIPEKAADTMLPCLKEEKEVETDKGESNNHHRRLLWGSLERFNSRHRMLLEASTVPHCSEGKVPLISLHGLYQLHIFIFFLAIFHVFYSALTMALGREKISSWKEWEQETLSPDYQFSNDPARFRLTHETSFVKQHTSFWNRLPILFYTVSFFRQFFRSVRKADYSAMRHGFINVHLAPDSKFDFQKYIKRSLEDDFKMGSHMKKSIFDKCTSKAIMKWHQNVKKRNPKGSPTTSPKGSPKAASVHPTRCLESASDIALTPQRNQDTSF